MNAFRTMSEDTKYSNIICYYQLQLIKAFVYTTSNQTYTEFLDPTIRININVLYK